MVTVSRKTWSFVVPMLMLLAMVLLAKSAWFQTNPDALSMGIAFDLTLTIPLVYFLIIRKTAIPKITVVPIFVVGIVTASLVIPAEHQFYLGQIKTWVLPIVELTAITVIFLKIRQMALSFKKVKSGTFDFYQAMHQAVEGVIPKPANILFATEIATFYYGFFSWKKRKLSTHEFSYHKDNSAIAVLWVVLMLVLVETAVLHILLMQWSVIAAWILSGISIYTGFQVFGMVRSLSKRPIAINEDALKLPYGIMASATIDYTNIASIELSSSDIEESDTIRRLSPLSNLAPHNVIIHLNDCTTFKSLYGIKKTCKAIALHVDEPETFKAKLESKVADL